MFQETLFDLIILFAAGLTGWAVFKKLNFPAPEILGPIVLIGTLRALQVDLPQAPSFLFPAAQVVIGVFIGSMLDKNAVRELKSMIPAIVIIVAWSTSLIIIIGFLLMRYSSLDLQTALLSTSVGGLPEISVLAVASNANIAVIIVMQMVRMLLTVAFFPFLIKRLQEKKDIIPGKKLTGNQVGGGNSLFKVVENDQKDNSGNTEQAKIQQPAGKRLSPETLREMAGLFIKKLNSRKNQLTIHGSLFRFISTLGVATAGGLMLNYLQVPAGLMVGSTLFVTLVSTAGMPIYKVPKIAFRLLIITIGINLADNIVPETLSTLARLEFVLPIIIVTATIFASSLGIAYLIHRITGWDYSTCILASAPGGFTVMTALAIQQGLDPFRVSILHVCRLISIKMLLPLIFMILV